MVEPERHRDQPAPEERDQRQPGLDDPGEVVKGQPRLDARRPGVNDADTAHVSEYRAGLHRKKRPIQSASVCCSTVTSSSGRVGSRSPAAHRRIGRQPVEDLAGGPLGHLELRDVTRIRGHPEAPRRVGRGDSPGCADRHQPVLLSVQQQYRHRDRAHGGQIGLAPRQHTHQRTGRCQELHVDVGVSATDPCHLHVLLDHGLRDPLGVHAAQTQHVHRELLRRTHPATGLEHGVAEWRHGIQTEAEGHERVRAGIPQTRHRGVHEDQPGHRLGVSHRLQDRDHGAHRVADQNRRTNDHITQEPLQHLLIGGDRGRMSACLGEAEADEVHRNDVAGVSQQRGQRRPVDQRPAQPVHHHEQRPVGRSAVVDVVDGHPQISPPRGRSGMPSGRFAAHPPSVTVVWLTPRSVAQLRAPGSRVAMVLPLMTLTSS